MPIQLNFGLRRRNYAWRLRNQQNYSFKTEAKTDTIGVGPTFARQPDRRISRTRAAPPIPRRCLAASACLAGRDAQAREVEFAMLLAAKALGARDHKGSDRAQSRRNLARLVEPPICA
jgi:hypothetical protein